VDRVGIAVSKNECDDTSSLCVPYSVSIAKSSRVDATGTAIEGYSLAHTVPALPESTYLSAPVVYELFGRSWVIWSEAPDGSDSGPGRWVRAFVADPEGDPVAWPPGVPAGEASPVVANATVSSPPGTIVSPLGITVYTGDSTHDPATGETDYFFVLQHYDFEFQPLGDPVILPVGTRPPGAPSSQTGVFAPGRVVLDDAILFSWNEWDGPDGQVMRFARLECTP